MPAIVQAWLTGATVEECGLLGGRGALLMDMFSAEIERVRAFVLQRGYQPGSVVEVFTRGNKDETLVVHFAQADPRLIGDDKYLFFDTPSGIRAMLDLETGRIVIPESL